MAPMSSLGLAECTGSSSMASSSGSDLPFMGCDTVMPSQITNPGDAEEKRYSCHRVDRVTVDSAHHCLAPKRYSSTPRHPQGCVILSRCLLSLFAACHHLVKEIFIIPERLAVHHHRLSDDGVEGKREAGGQAQDSKEYCASDKDIVEVVRTEYVYTRPPPWSDVLPTIHIITPTYSRPVQKAELTRLANTFLHVPNLHWILVEDSQRRTPLVTRLLRETGLNYTHLNVETPRNYKLRGDTRDPRIPRGTMQRNLALRWLRETFNANSSQAGIVYFADDDNTYSLELFEEVRAAAQFSVWPVAFVGGLRYESPKVNAAGKVYGWKTVFDPHRPFAIDMAGFAINLRLILFKPQAYFKLRGVKGGYQESSLLRELVTLNDLEPKAANCTKILVWHTRTEKPVLVNEGKKGFTDPNVEI
ncbi:hypothetical protein L3Q82_018971 [Scortum barcoo]|uniref:Uncharacterized protein n=1 Tax=Scortum barcoo TaxID=214431 RepID=A0ACB8VG90_9TELE|nr:hypothetical protein L3Q82_018971 [Scortum barcoo]